MIINNDTTPSRILPAVMKELKKGSSDSRHPFRYFTLATPPVDNTAPGIRMLVLREIMNDWSIIAYTDARTSKVEELDQLNQASLLFWHSYHKIQFSCKAEVELHQNDEFAQQYWKKDVHGAAQKAYTPLVRPGTEIAHPGEAHEWPQDYSSKHFCMLEFKPYEMQILQINGKNHRRIQYQREESTEDWQASWIAP